MSKHPISKPFPVRLDWDLPFEDDWVTLGLALDDVEDPDCLVRGACCQSLSVIVHLSIVLHPVSDPVQTA